MKAVNPETGATYELRDGQWVRTYGAADDVGVLESLAIGAGQNFTRLGRGALNITAGALGNDKLQAELAAANAAEAGPFAELQAERPISSTVGQMLPAIATGGGVGVLARGVGLGGVLASEAAQGAAFGGLEMTDTGDLAQQGQNAIMQGALGVLGGAAGELAQRGLQGVRAAGRDIAQTRRAVRMRAEGRAQVGPQTGAITSETPTAGAQAGRAANTAGEADALLRQPTSTPGAERARLKARAEALGLRLTRGDMLDSGPMKQLEAWVESYPLTSAVALKRKALNQDALNRQTLRAIGVDDPAVLKSAEVSDAIIGQRQNALADDFATIADDIGTVEFDQGLMRDLSALEDASGRGLGARNKVAGYVQQIVEEFDGTTADAKTMMGWRSDLVSERSRIAAGTAPGRGRDVAQIGELIDALDRAVLRQKSGTVAKAYQTARNQYRALSTIARPNMRSGSNVKAGTLINRLQRDYPAEFLGGDRFGTVASGEAGDSLADWFDTARVIKEFGDIVGDSGTATRMSLQNLANAPAREAAVNLGAYGVQLGLEGAGELVSAAIPAAQGAARATGGTGAKVGGAVARVTGADAERD